LRFFFVFFFGAVVALLLDEDDRREAAAAAAEEEEEEEEEEDAAKAAEEEEEEAADVVDILPAIPPDAPVMEAPLRLLGWHQLAASLFALAVFAAVVWENATISLPVIAAGGAHGWVELELDVLRFFSSFLSSSLSAASRDSEF
jgi:hypothetical protein